MFAVNLVLEKKFISIHHQIYYGVDNIFLLLFLINFKALQMHHIHRLKPYQNAC